MGSGEKPPGLSPVLQFLCFWCPNQEYHPGYYVVRPGGLFPAPLPQDSALCQKVTQLFWVLGVFLAKTLQVFAIRAPLNLNSSSMFDYVDPSPKPHNNHKYHDDMQDSRLVDLPLSPAFLKLLCGGEVSGMVRESSDIVTRYNPVAQNHFVKNVGVVVL